MALVPRGRDPVLGLLDRRRVPVEDLERVEVEVDRMRVAGEVDEPPDLGSVQHREEGGGVLEARRDRAPARDAFLTVRLRLDERDDGLVGAWVEDELAHGQHRRRALDLGLLFDERDRADDGAGELVAARPPEVGREHLRARGVGSGAPRRRECAALPGRAAGRRGRRAPRSRGRRRCRRRGRAAVFQRVSSVPGARSEKSTRRSARSADASTRPWPGIETGAWSSPPSLPIWVIRS